MPWRHVLGGPHRPIPEETGEERRRERRTVELSQRDAQRLGPKTFQAGRAAKCSSGTRGARQTRTGTGTGAATATAMGTCKPQVDSVLSEPSIMPRSGERCETCLSPSERGGNFGVAPPSAPALRPAPAIPIPRRLYPFWCSSSTLSPTWGSSPVSPTPLTAAALAVLCDVGGTKEGWCS